MYQNHRRYYHFHRCCMSNDKIGLLFRGIDTGQINSTPYFAYIKLTIKQIGNEKEARQCKQHRDGPSRFLETDGIGKCGNLYRTNIGKVTAAEKSITGKSPVSATVFPVSIAAVRTQRTLGSGKAVFTVSAMGFGCMGLNHHRSQSPDEKACTRLIHEAIERGVTLFDTAESYGYHKMRNW